MNVPTSFGSSQRNRARSPVESKPAGRAALSKVQLRLLSMQPLRRPIVGQRRVLLAREGSQPVHGALGRDERFPAHALLVPGDTAEFARGRRLERAAELVADLLDARGLKLVL